MIKKVQNYIQSKIKLFFLDENEKNFIKLNNDLFNQTYNHKENQILIENNSMQTNHIAVSIFSKILSEIHDARLVGYQPRIKFDLLNRLKIYIIDYKVKKIYKSFGVDKFLFYHKDNYLSLANNLTNKLVSEIKSKSDLLNLVIDNIKVGDLIYDQYLTEYKVPTVNINSDKLRKILLDFSILFYYWKDLFSKKKNIKGLVIGHACYFTGVSARIAIHFNIPVYQVNLQNIYYLSKDNLFPSSEFHTYSKDFEKLEINKKKKCISEARERIKLIFEGQTNIDQLYIKNSAYNKNKSSKKILANKKKIKILIASHSFYDSPNGTGTNLFSDFWEWLEFLGKLSNITDYEWYIKTHPGIGIRDTKTIDDFVSRYKKIVLIPNLVSHNQLIEEGINIVLTVYGSIGIEYASKNITVINASLNNPHISYDFNIHPKSREELNDILRSLNNYINLNLSSDDVYKCYYMRYLYHNQNIFFSDFKSALNQLGGYEELFTSKIYDKWINYFSPIVKTKIEINLKKFILSGEYKIKSNWN